MSHMVLSHLQANDGATLDELCAATGLNADAVRHILTGLVTASLVSRAQMAASEQEERDARERQHELLTLLRSLDERVAKLERDRD